jgi:hypothetical protein
MFAAWVLHGAFRHGLSNNAGLICTPQAQSGTAPSFSKKTRSGAISWRTRSRACRIAGIAVKLMVLAGTQRPDGGCDVLRDDMADFAAADEFSDSKMPSVGLAS